MSKSPGKSTISWLDRAPFKQWAINVIGSMPGSKEKQFIITAIDFYTCWPVAQATKNHNGPEIWRFIGKEISAKFGKPKQIVSDKSREFMSSKTQDYFKFDNIDYLPTTPYHP